jgi:hypothetical protein
MRVIVYEPGKSPKEADIANELRALQKVVGGYIETVRLPHQLVLVCNEEGLLNNLPYNRTVQGHRIVGTFFVCRDGGEDFTGLRDRDLERAKAF